MDSIRAVLQSGNFTGISSKAIVGTYGYSGGGVVGAITTELQPTYAPELNISGTVVGGLMPDIINALSTVPEAANCYQFNITQNFTIRTTEPATSRRGYWAYRTTTKTSHNGLAKT